MTKCEEIRKHLNDNGLKQSWVAEKADIPYPRFRRLMTGRGKLLAEEADRINEVLGTRI